MDGDLVLCCECCVNTIGCSGNIPDATCDSSSVIRPHITLEICVAYNHQVVYEVELMADGEHLVSGMYGNISDRLGYKERLQGVERGDWMDAGSFR
jgi:hypothetical protein